MAFTDTKVAECLQADKQKLHTDLNYKFSKITLNLTEGNQKLELNGPPAEVKGAFMFLYQQLLKRFQLRYPQIRDVAFEISGPPAKGRQTPEPSPDRNKCKCHGVSREVSNEEQPVPKANSNNEAAVTALSKELADWKKKFEILQNNAKSKCLEFQTELDKCKEDLTAKDQRNIDLEKEKENLLKLDEVKTTQVGQAMEQVAGIYKKYEESQAKLQELEKGSVKAPEPYKIKKEVDTEQQEMERTRKELSETKKKLRQLEVCRVMIVKVINLISSLQGKYIHKRTMLELKEKEVTQLRRENRRLEVENGRETVNCDGIVTVQVSP